MNLRTARLPFLLLILACVIAVAVKRHFFPAPLMDGIKSGSGERLSVNISAPFYRQHDPRWNDQLLGSSKCNMGGYGCTVCSLAMALSSQGFAIDPGELNRRLASLGGYTDAGLVIWGSVAKLTKGAFKIEASNTPTVRDIDNQLKQGNPVLAKVLFNDTVTHWVLLTGKRERTFLIHDPLGLPTEKPLDHYSKGVYAIRYLKKQ